jgi:hypothetical protein
MTHRTATTGIAFLCAATWLGCSSTMPRRQPLSLATILELNEELQGHEATVVAADRGKEERLTGEYVVVEHKTTHLLEQPPDGAQPRSRSLPTAAVQRITIVKRGQGALQGLGLGATIGLVGGAMLGALAASGQSSSSSSGISPTGVGAVAGGFLGALLGLPIGASVGAGLGQRTTFEFDERAPLSGRDSPNTGELCPVDKLGETATNEEGRALRCSDYFGDGRPRWTEQGNR